VHGISRATLYKWRQRYRGMDASEMKRMYANLAMELDVAKYIIEKKL
jgi:putative transposase